MVSLEPDEHKLIEIVRQIKRRVGFGTAEFGFGFADATAKASIQQGKVNTIQETYTHKI